MSAGKWTPGRMRASRASIISEGHLTIATCPSTSRHHAEPDEAEANAAELVRRWNAHEALVAALEETHAGLSRALKRLTDCNIRSNDTHQSEAALEAAREALAAARGVPR